MPTAEKAMKEIHNEMPVAKKERTDHKCLWQRKKERPNHKCWWQTKNGCLNQSSKQRTPNERNKQLKPPQNPKRLLTCKHKVEKNTHKKHTTKSQQSNRLLSATKEWTNTVIREQSKNNDKQMESQITITLTNPSLTRIPSRKAKAAD